MKPRKGWPLIVVMASLGECQAGLRHKLDDNVHATIKINPFTNRKETV
jgi:hypothetical protein